MLPLGLLEAQTPVTIRQDCTVNFNLNAAGLTSAAIDNTQTGCYHWQIAYNSRGFSVLSLAVESAPNLGGTPGTWVTFAGATILSGVNPNTAITEASTEFQGYNPFVRVRLVSATGTGTVNGTLYGCRQPGCAQASGASSGTTSDVNIKQVGGTNVVTGGEAGALGVGGLAAAGAVPAGNPLLAAGFDGTDVRNISTDATGRVNVNAAITPSGTQNVNLSQVNGTTTVNGGQAGALGVGGLAASGAVPVGNPLPVAGFDGTDVRNISTDATGRVNVNANITPSGTQNVNVAQVNGNTTATAATVGDANAGAGIQSNAPSLFNGVNFDRQQSCPNYVIVDDSTMGTVQIIAGMSPLRIHVCKMTLTAASTVSVQLIGGTGSNCGTGTGNVSGLYQQVLTIAEDFLTDQSVLTTGMAGSLCLNLSAAVRVTGQISYTQF